MIQQKGSISVSSVGNNDEFIKILAAAQKKLDKKLKFIHTDTDLLQYVNSLSLEMKTEKGEVLFRDNKNGLQYFPCVSKFVSFTDPEIKIPKDRKRNPFECAKIQLLLYKKANVSQDIPMMQNKIASFQCNCYDCYQIVMKGIFNGDGICL